MLRSVGAKRLLNAMAIGRKAVPSRDDLGSAFWTSFFNVHPTAR